MALTPTTNPHPSRSPPPSTLLGTALPRYRGAWRCCVVARGEHGLTRRWARRMRARRRCTAPPYSPGRRRGMPGRRPAWERRLAARDVHGRGDAGGGDCGRRGCGICRRSSGVGGNGGGGGCGSTDGGGGGGGEGSGGGGGAPRGTRCAGEASLSLYSSAAASASASPSA